MNFASSALSALFLIGIVASQSLPFSSEKELEQPETALDFSNFGGLDLSHRALKKKKKKKSKKKVR